MTKFAPVELLTKYYLIHGPKAEKNSPHFTDHYAWINEKKQKHMLVTGRCISGHQMYGIKEIEDYWERNAGGPSPKFPAIEYFNVNGMFHSFDLFRELSPSYPEPLAIYQRPDETLRLLDQQGRIFKYAFHKNGFYYPVLIEEKPTFEMMKLLVQEIDHEELSEFVSEDKFVAFLENYCV